MQQASVSSLTIAVSRSEAAIHPLVVMTASNESHQIKDTNKEINIGKCTENLARKLETPSARLRRMKRINQLMDFPDNDRWNLTILAMNIV